MDLKRLEELKNQVMARIDKSPPEEDFCKFVLEEGQRAGVIEIHLYSETVVDFNKHALSHIKSGIAAARRGQFLNALWLMGIGGLKLVIQVSPAMTNPYVNKEDNLLRILIRPKMAIYPTAFLVFFISAGLLASMTPFILGRCRILVFMTSTSLLVYGVVWLVCRLFPSMDSHEICHAYQFILLERIRRELKLPITWRHLCGLMSPLRLEYSLIRVVRAPPDHARLKRIVKDLFKQVSAKLPVE